MIVVGVQVGCKGCCKVFSTCKVSLNYKGTDDLILGIFS